MTELTDEEIAQQVQQGNIQSFGLLVERFEPKLLRYARRFLFGHEDAQDIVQDVFLKTYANMQSYNSAYRFSPWIYRIAHNEFINAIKKKGREPLSYFSPDTLFPHPVAKERPDAELDDQELKATLDKYLEKLDPKYREPLVLYYFEEMDYQGIADILRIPVSTVGVRLNRAKTMLQTMYRNQET